MVNKSTVVFRVVEVFFHMPVKISQDQPISLKMFCSSETNLVGQTYKSLDFCDLKLCLKCAFFSVFKYFFLTSIQ